MKKYIIGFDIDGVVLDFNNLFLDVAKNEFNILKNVTPNDVTSYNYWDCLNISKKEALKLINNILENPCKYKIKAVTGATEALTELSKYINLLFVTARPCSCMEQTKKLVYKTLFNINKNKIKIVHSSDNDKSDILKNFGVEYFVDDRLKNCRDINRNGIKALLFNHPWNQSNEPFFRINGWKEISNFIFKNILDQRY